MFKIFSSVVAIFLLFCHICLRTSCRPDHVIRFEKGQDLFQIVKDDQSFGKATAFFFVENLPFLKKRIATGEYPIFAKDTVWSFLVCLFGNKTCIRKITFPEGATVKVIVEKLNKNPFLTGEIAELPKEGEVMPDTYYYKFRDKRQLIINNMKEEMKKFMSQTKNQTKLTTQQIITLASIIEKESGNKNELALISSVFHNRICKNMRLQSDPTVIYGLSQKTGRLSRELRRSDLWSDSEYNTYRKNGIPPGPICCPGRLAIQAALAPAPTDFLYFVANKSEKKHIFAKSYKEHLKNVKFVKKQAAALFSEYGTKPLQTSE